MTDVTLPVKRTRGDTLRERMTANAYERILPARYLRQDESGAIAETPEEMVRRVAENVAQAEADHGGDPGEWADRFEDLLTDLAFVPNSPTLMNAGTDLQQLSACFVVSPTDSLDSIFDTVKQAAQVFQSGGGVGYSFSALRPAGDAVRSTGGVASGPVSFMRVFDEMCEQIKQGGRRRGAQMGVLRVDHPDVGRFCVAKRREGVLSNFNVSVGVTDAFEAALRAGERYPLVNPRTGERHEVTRATAEFYSTDYEDAPTDVVAENVWRDYAADVPGLDAYRGETDLEVGDRMTLPAGFVWRLVVDGAWRNGEPGVFMLDEANRDHSFDVDAHPDHWMDATNPCGEQPLENYEACTLGHVNLSLVVADDATPWPAFDADGDLEAAVEAFLDQAIDWSRLTAVVRDGTRFLDDVVTVGEFPVAEMRAKADALRKVGLGVMGFAELLLQVGVRYGSPESFEVGRQVMAHVTRVATETSRELAEERGVFPDWPDSKYATPTDYPDWFERHTGESADKWAGGYPVRNHSVTTIAPTGTTSMLANTSSGCEPLYDVVYFKNVGRDVQGDEMLVEFDDYFLQVLAANDVDVEAVREEARRLLDAGEYEGPRSLSIPDEIADLFVTASQVDADAHVRMQAALQEHVDSAISKTINVSYDATRDDVDRAFRLAMDLGCKGLTVYRDRSRSTQVLTTRPDQEFERTGPGEDGRCCPL